MSSDLQLYAYKQLEYARKLRLHQDMLRLAIPAAYLTFLGAAAGIVKEASEINHYLYLLSAFIGTGVFIAAVAEHYFYVAFRNWERRIEFAILEPSIPQANQNDGDLVHPQSSSTPEKRLAEGELQNLMDVISFSRAREKYSDINRPNIAHVTMTMLLLWVAIFSSIQYSIVVGAYFPVLGGYGSAGVGLVLTALHMSIYKWWHAFYSAAINPLLDALKTK